MQKPTLIDFAKGIVIALFAGFAANVPADDTEIFFGPQQLLLGGSTPNILLALDSSGSMSEIVPGGTQTRFQAMKQATDNLLANLNNVNVGLMRFTDPGGPILYPVTELDAPSADSLTETAVVFPAASRDDAEEINSSNVVATVNASNFVGNSSLQGRVLALGRGTTEVVEVRTNRIGSSSDEVDQEEDLANGNLASGGQRWDISSAQINGVRFFGLQSAGLSSTDAANVSSVTIDFTAQTGNSGGTGSILFSGEAAADPAIFSDDTDFDVSGRADTAAVATWSTIPAFVDGSVYTSPELSSIYAEVRSDHGWSGDNALVYFAQTSAGATLQRSPHRHRNASESERMKLKLSVTEPQTVGIRFPQLGIPNGARISSARLVFTAAPHPHTDGARDTLNPSQPLLNPITQSTPVRLGIRGELSGNPCFFAATGAAAPSASDGCTPATTAPGRISTRPQTTAAVTGWNPGTWTPDEVYDSPDIGPVIQEIINQDAFCGGNAISLQILHESGTGQRLAYAADDGARAPVLYVEYTPTDLVSTGSNRGCLNQTVTQRPNRSSDNAYTFTGSRGSTVFGPAGFVIGATNVVTSGLRFQAIKIPQGSRIIDATLTMKPRGSHTGSARIRVQGEARDDSGVFSTSRTSISGRPKTTAAVDATLQASNTTFTVSGLGPVIQEIINRPGWVSGKNLSLIITPLSVSSQFTAEAFETAPLDAPLLTITIRRDVSTLAETVVTNRTALRGLVAAMSNPNWTPLVGTQLEAARYFRGLGVLHGKRLGHLTPTNTVLSHPRSYTGGLQLPLGCGVGQNPVRCTSISGSPIYDTPIDNECSPNHFVLLTDGEANHNANDDGVDHQVSAARSFVGGTCITRRNNPDGTGTGVISTIASNRTIGASESCGRDIAWTLFNPPDSDALPLKDRRPVVTHTVAFNTDATGVRFLQDVAANGGGSFNEATNADNLLAVFNRIVSNIIEAPSTFAAPATSVNTFNRLRNRDDVYFALFKPSVKARWRGNIKRYRVDGENIVGADGEAAVNPTTGEFTPTSQSFWDVDGNADGGVLDQGGAAEVALAIDPDTRNVYTFLGDYSTLADSPGGVDLTALPTDFNDLDTADKSTLAGQLGVSQSDAVSLFDWVRGEDIDDDDGDNDTTEARYTYGDPLHASPVVVTLGGDADAPVEMVVAATNDGGIRWLDAATGVEKGVFFPPEQLTKQREMRINRDGAHIYGLDLTPSIWVRDLAPTGVIQPSTGDFVRVVFGERDGGNRYYAIDITPSTDLTSDTTPGDFATIDIDPKLLWKIDGNDEDYSDLGLTWSEPVIRRVQFADEDTSRTVVIFGGGNDARFDRQFHDLRTEAAVQSFDPKGNIIYIVDAVSGRLLTSIGGSNTDAKLQVDGMNYPIPSTISTVSSTGRREIDRMYVGDLGGNVWRIDLNPLLTDTSVNGEVATVGRLAAVSLPPTNNELADNPVDGDSGAHGANSRKFYYPPSIVRQDDSVFSAESRHTLVILGTGTRPNPLNVVTEDHLFTFRDLREEPLEPNATGVAQDYPRRLPTEPGETVPAGSVPIGGTNGGEFATDLVDVTDNPFQTIINGEQVESGSPLEELLAALKTSLGWYIKLPALETVDGGSHIGEKVLNPAAVGLGTLFFSAYTPGDFDSSATACRSDVGITRIYALNLSTGAANIEDFSDPPSGGGTDNADAVLTGDDRSTSQPLTGNPGGTTLLNTDTLKSITGTRVIDIGDIPPVRTYWFQRL